MATVVLQPDGASGIDTAIYSYTSNTPQDKTRNYGTTITLSVGWLSGGTPSNPEGKALYKFDLSSIPPSAIITSAILSLWCSLEDTSANLNFTLHRSLVEWFEGIKDGAVPTGEDGSTWDLRNHNGSVAWVGGPGGAAGSDYATTPTDTTTVTGTGAFFDWDVTPDVQDFVDGSLTNHGWWLIGDMTVGSGSAKRFRGSDHATVANRPKLTIEYVTDITPDPATFVLVTNGPGPVIASYLVTPEPASFALVSNSPDFTEVDVIPTAASMVLGSFIGRVHILRPAPPPRTPMPLLYITDGTIGRGGIPNLLNLINCRTGFCLESWNPAIAQYKDGGLFFDSPIADGRRPILKRYQNVIEVFNLKAGTYDQNRLINYLQNLQNWVERAIEYWETPWAKLPIYLVARGPFETNTRYAMIYKGDIPNLSSPYQQPFFSHYSHSSVIEGIQLSLERGHWQDVPPGQSTCVPLSNNKIWTWQTSQNVTAGISGQIYSLVQADNNDILAGSGDAARIYRSTDDGATWTLVQTLGSGSAWVRGLCKDVAGNLYAAVGNGSSSHNGVWKSTNNGGTWTRVLAAPATSLGYSDVVTDIHGYIYAVGPSFASGSPNALLSYSQNAGGTWTSLGLVGGSASNNHATIIAGIGYFGANNQYQQAVRSQSAVIFNPTPVSPQTMNPSNFGGTAGLDIEAFQYEGVFQEDSNGRVISHGGTQREILRAVLVGSNTIIWVANHQEGSNNQFTFAQRSSISGQTLSAMYADPIDLSVNPGPNNRTIWVGSSGNIYKSINRGFTWELISTGLTGSVTAFLRTSSGRLIAASNAQITSVGSSFTFPPSSTFQNSITVGDEESCDGVLIANKSSSSNLTHVKVFDASGGTYTDILPATSLPVELYPSVPAVGDILYAGAQTNVTGYEIGPFSSLVFDIETVSSGLTIVWEYWNGAAWTSLSLTKDNTDSFKTAGVRTVHWLPSSNWTTTSVDGSTGYWVRARITAVSSPIAPTQANINIFSITQPYAEIDGSGVDGEIPALAQISLHNLAQGSGSYRIDKIFIGFRTFSRGNAFNSFINLSDQQEPFGVTITNGLGSFSNSPFTPTGRILSLTGPSLLTWQTMASVSLSTTIARDYYGAYRVFVRCKQVNGVAGQYKIRLRSIFGSDQQNITTSKEVATKVASSLSSSFELIDLGRLDIPSGIHRADEEIVDLHQMDVQIYTSSATPTIYLVDLVLIPTDEWAATFTGAAIIDGQFADLDSIQSVKTTVRGVSKWNDGRIISIFETVANSPIRFQVRNTQRIWILCGENIDPSGVYSNPGISTLLTSNKVQRYLTMRGVI